MEVVARKKRSGPVPPDTVVTGTVETVGTRGKESDQIERKDGVMMG